MGVVVGGDALKRRVLIVEDEPLAAQQLQRQLEALDCEVVGSARTAERAVELAQAERPSLVIADVRLGDGESGIDAVRRIRERCDVGVVFITAFSDDGVHHDIVASHPLAYLLKPYTHAQLRATVELALSRLPHLSDLERRAALLDQILAEVRHSMWSDTKGGRLPAPLRAPRRPASPLSSREEEVLELFVEGFATSTIARRLFVSTHTVRNHLKNISRKYDVRSQVELRELFARER